MSGGTDAQDALEELEGALDLIEENALDASGVFGRPGTGPASTAAEFKAASAPYLERRERERERREARKADKAKKTRQNREVRELRKLMRELSKRGRGT